MTREDGPTRIETTPPQPEGRSGGPAPAPSGLTRLLMVRHGETVWNALGRQQGQLDSPLDERGQDQARCLGQALRNRGVQAVYTSDLGRARQTADAIGAALGLAPIAEPRLREQHLGPLQGLTLAAFRRDHPDLYAGFTGGDPDWALPGGESVRQVCLRAAACVLELAARHPGATLALVTHGGVLAPLFRHVVGLPLGTPRRFSLLNASIGAFTAEGGHLRLESWGEVHHLEAMGADDDW